MTKEERMKEIMKASPDFGKGVGYKMCVVDELHDMKEQLEKEAKAYALEWGDKTDGTYACCRDGYLAAAEPREKRIEELEAQIEKMKCCQNCRKFNNLSYDCTCAEVCNEWELKN